MTKKESLQEAAKDMEGYSDSLTIAQLEELIEKNQPDEDEGDEPSSKDDEKESSDDKAAFKKYEMQPETVKVEAVEIETVQNRTTGAVLGFGPEKETISVSENFYRKHNPRAGGYLAKDEKGNFGYISKLDFEKFEEV